MSIAINNFRVDPSKTHEFEQAWRERESFLSGIDENGAELYASHATWRDEPAFRALTESDAFRRAHAQGGRTAGSLLGPPKFVGWNVVL